MHNKTSMDMYSEKAVRHFMTPCNTEPLGELSGIGCASSDTLEDLLELSIHIDDSGTIDGVRCRSFGCPAAVASGSAFSELVLGKPVSDALKLKPEDVLSATGGLPSRRVCYARLPLVGLEAAVENYRERIAATPGRRARRFSHRRVPSQSSRPHGTQTHCGLCG